jgi:hypothetical protein
MKRNFRTAAWFFLAFMFVTWLAGVAKTLAG